MCSACRIASATMVSVGLAAAPVVITEPSLTNRPGTSCASPYAPTTPSSGRACMIGDRAVDITAGRANGTGTAGVSWGFGSEDELRQAGPDVLVGSMAALVEYFQ